MLLFVGAVAVGVGTAWLTEWVQRLGRLESGASLGVVFTAVFALGLLLIRLDVDDVHIDVDCVLFGIIETAALDTFPGTSIPRPLLINGAIFLVNLLLLLLFYKELKLAAFDPSLARSLGIPARGIHYGLMAVTAMTVVAAFTTVGSILVIGLLIIPTATALLLSERLKVVLALSVCVGAISAVLGHAFTLTLPRMIFSRLGYPTIEDAGTAGMMSVTAGMLFLTALFFAPKHGMISKLVHRFRLGLKIAGDDVLGLLFRFEEQTAVQAQRHLGARTRCPAERNQFTADVVLGPQVIARRFPDSWNDRRTRADRSRSREREVTRAGSPAVGSLHGQAL